MLSDVTVSLTGGQSAGTESFGIPVFVVPNVVTKKEAVAAVPYTECTTLEDVIAAGFNTNSTVYEAVSLMRSQKNKPKTFAVYGSTSASAVAAVQEILDESWRQLITVDLGSDKIADVAKIIEATDNKIYFASVSIEKADTMTDADFKTAWKAATAGMSEYDRTVVMYYDDTIQTPEAALVGETAARDVGSFTYKNMVLKGVPALALTESRVKIIGDTDDAAYGLTIVKKAGDIVTSDGRSASGEYIDVVDSYDWIIQNIEHDTQKVLNNSAKVPFTNPGITQLEDATRSVLKTAFTNGMIAPTEDNDNVGDYSTDFAPASEATAAEKASRHYSGGNFSFVLAGAIHTAEINGTVTF